MTDYETDNCRFVRFFTTVRLREYRRYWTQTFRVFSFFLPAFPIWHQQPRRPTVLNRRFQACILGLFRKRQYDTATAPRRKNPSPTNAGRWQSAFCAADHRRHGAYFFRKNIGTKTIPGFLRCYLGSQLIGF